MRPQTAAQQSRALLGHARAPEALEIQRRRYVANLVASGASAQSIVELCCDVDPRSVAYADVAALDFTPGTARRMYREVLAELREAYRADLVEVKAAQLHRLHADLVAMRSQVPTPWTAVRQHESLLADVAGTRAPVRVQFTGDDAVRGAFADIVSGMSVEELNRIAERQLIAERRRGQVIDTTGQAAE